MKESKEKVESGAEEVGHPVDELSAHEIVFLDFLADRALAKLMETAPSNTNAMSTPTDITTTSKKKKKKKKKR